MAGNDEAPQNAERVVSVTLSEREYRLLQDAANKLGLDQEAFLKACVLQGINRAERYNQGKLER
jgi:hypothetical protein